MDIPQRIPRLKIFLSRPSTLVFRLRQDPRLYFAHSPSPLFLVLVVDSPFPHIGSLSSSCPPPLFGLSPTPCLCFLLPCSAPFWSLSLALNLASCILQDVATDYHIPTLPTANV